jgi:hypothetical protein
MCVCMFACPPHITFEPLVAIQEDLNEITKSPSFSHFNIIEVQIF